MIQNEKYHELSIVVAVVNSDITETSFVPFSYHQYLVTVFVKDTVDYYTNHSLAVIYIHVLFQYFFHY